jgi:hypothetical protein
MCHSVRDLLVFSRLGVLAGGDGTPGQPERVSPGPLPGAARAAPPASTAAGRAPPPPPSSPPPEREDGRPVTSVMEAARSSLFFPVPLPSPPPFLDLGLAGSGSTAAAVGGPASYASLGLGGSAARPRAGIFTLCGGGSVAFSGGLPGRGVGNRRRPSTASSSPCLTGSVTTATGSTFGLLSLQGCGGGGGARRRRRAARPGFGGADGRGWVAAFSLVVRRLLGFEQGRKVYPSDFKRRTAGSQAPVLPQIRHLMIGSVAPMAGFGSP